MNRVRMPAGELPSWPCGRCRSLMPLSELQREVATIALRAAARNGFALAGGNALIAHGIIDRPTDDIVMWVVKVSARELSQAETRSSTSQRPGRRLPWLRRSWRSVSLSIVYSTTEHSRM
jgi:hypothetical protein